MPRLINRIKGINLARYGPPGYNIEKEKNFFLAGIACAAIFSFGFPLRLADAVYDLYEYRAGQRVLRDGAIMPDCRELLGLSLVGFVVLAIAMMSFVFFHYSYHREGSRPDYLMRRLPDGFEYHRRCWTLPLAAAALSICSGVILLIIYYLIYLTATPDKCLAPGQWSGLWRGGFLFWL